MLRLAGSVEGVASASIGDKVALGGRAGLSRRALLAAGLLALALAAALLGALSAGRSAIPVAASRPGVSQKGLLSLPLAAQGPVSAALGAGSPAYRVNAFGGGFTAANPAQHLRSSFAASGVSVSSGPTQLRLRLRGIGYGSALAALGRVAPRAHSNRVLYSYPGLSESYSNGPLGLEQAFTIARAPGGHAAGPLTLSVALSGNARPSLGKGGQSITLTHAGDAALRYTGLTATDARGHLLRSWLALEGGLLLLRVDARDARYPLRIDPFIQRAGSAGARPAKKNEEEGAFFGESVALSSDGSTALISAPFDNKGFGTIWVFTRSGSTWTQQAEFGATGVSKGSEFGASIALSADGNTALIGSPKTHEGAVGAAYVFTRSGSTWTQQGEKLIPGDLPGQFFPETFGHSVALSADGNTALVGAPNENAAWVFTRSEGAWTQQGGKLTVSEKGIGFGRSVALSGDGNTALIGAPGYAVAKKSVGAAWVFTRSEAAWTQQGGMLTGGGEVNAGNFGLSVALSGDGNTALIGGPRDDEEAGAAWVFTRSEAAWTQQGEKLTGGELRGEFGEHVALDDDGNTALIATDGEAAWVFTRAEGAWTGTSHVIPGEGSRKPLALSAEGTTALIGRPELGGAAWVFALSEGELALQSELRGAGVPTIKKVLPKKGPAAGGTVVTITGAHFLGATAVDFGSSAAHFVVNSKTSISAEAPAGATGTVDVTVTTPNGTSAVSNGSRFTYR